MNDRRLPLWWMAALRIRVLYALASGLDIAISNEIVESAAEGDNLLLIGLQSLKGLGFVAACGILIFSSCPL